MRSRMKTWKGTSSPDRPTPGPADPRSGRPPVRPTPGPADPRSGRPPDQTGCYARKGTLIASAFINHNRYCSDCI